MWISNCFIQKIAFREMVKKLPLLRRAGNNGRPWVHAVMCDNIYSDMCMYDNTRFNLVKSANRYRCHLTVRCTTRAYNGTIATKGLFIIAVNATVPLPCWTHYIGCPYGSASNINSACIFINVWMEQLRNISSILSHTNQKVLVSHAHQ